MDEERGHILLSLCLLSGDTEVYPCILLIIKKKSCISVYKFSSQSLGWNNAAFFFISKYTSSSAHAKCHPDCFVVRTININSLNHNLI